MESFESLRSSTAKGFEFSPPEVRILAPVLQKSKISVVSSYKKSASDIFLLGNEAFLSQSSGVTDNLSLFSARTFNFEDSVLAAPRFSHGRTHVYVGASTSFTERPSIFSGLDAILAQEVDIYGLTGTFRHGTSLGLAPTFSHAISTSDWRSNFSPATASSFSYTVWFSVTTSTGVVSSTQTTCDTVDHLRETGARLCVVDLHQWRQCFKSVSSYRVKI